MNNGGREKNDDEDNSSTQDSKEEAIVDFRLDEDLKKNKGKVSKNDREILEEEKVLWIKA